MDNEELFRQQAEILTEIISHFDMQKYSPGAYMMAFGKMLGAVAALSTNGEVTLEAAIHIAKGSRQAIRDVLPTLSKSGKNPFEGYFSPGNNNVH